MSQRARKSSPNSASKQGPMKATIPISSVLKNPSGFKHVSPTLSPTAGGKARISPDHPSGQRSPGATVYKVKSKTLGGSNRDYVNIIRRTASLDTIYLKGQWPRESFYLNSNILQVNKATQTDESDLTDPRRIHVIAENADKKLEKMLIRQRLKSTGRHLTSPSNCAIAGDHSILALPSASSQTSSSYITKATPISIPIKPLPKPTIRNSVEGLNQEIERLVLKNVSLFGTHISDRDKNEDYNKFYQVTPEGHRAPLAELFKATRSVNTQTPASGEVTSSSCHSSGPSSRESLSPLLLGHLDGTSESGGSQNSSPDQDANRLGTSPHINRFLAREPPDGCEKVHLKALDEHSGLTVDRGPLPSCSFQLKPSLGSAFKILQPNLHSSDLELPLVPSHNDLL